MPWTLKIKSHFDSAHRLCSYQGECSRLHGHTWNVEFLIRFESIDETSNMACDFKILKKEIKAILPDHVYLNEYLGGDNPTAEWLARFFYRAARDMLEKMKRESIIPFGLLTFIEKVVLWESPECGVEYSE